ncbi:hypothetical protein KCTC52924_02850 [Arenibacter antarcticus]|uniref:DUF4149 domain-containing protein n=1 Tax=Arenibacter antarcticus TaxID=2040469 RepID=A0ABW5VK79_9FLAO|nr:hypothetical protein [Arenibacter sp. H213]MCM4167269.1 hypothetical protein [Arenibacter sp. H213]
MKIATKYPIIPASVFIWIGFVGAISFMEAWLKFQVAELSLPLGLKIGKLVFHALNKVEWALALIIMIQIYRTAGKIIRWSNLYLLIPISILVIQTLVLLPILDIRADAVIENKIVPISHAHIYFVGMEVVKVAALFIYGLNYHKK